MRAPTIPLAVGSNEPPRPRAPPPRPRRPRCGASRPPGRPRTPTSSTGPRAPASPPRRARSPPSCSRRARRTRRARVTRVLRGSHPDLTWVVPSGAHEMRARTSTSPSSSAASRTPFEAARRVFVIERVDTMNDPAANSMLKTLEEPAAFAHLVLLTDRPSEVLPTIASRCLPVRFDAPSRRRAGRAPGPPRRRRRTPRGPAAGSRWATRPARWRSRSATGPALRGAAETYARAALRDDFAQRPWTALLERARALGEVAQKEVEDRVAADADYLPQRERRQGRARGRRRGQARAPGARPAARSTRRCGSAACGCATSPACSTAPRTSSTRPTA